MSSEEAAAPTKTGTDDDGMSWWYRWICKLAGVLGGICKYHTTWLWPYGCLMQDNSISHVFPDTQLCPCVIASDTFTTRYCLTPNTTSSGFTSHPTADYSTSNYEKMMSRCSQWHHFLRSKAVQQGFSVF